VTSRRLAATLACVAALPAAAAGTDAARWYLQVDNDVVFVTDRWYSSGIRIARVANVDGHELEFGVIHEIYMPEQRNWEPGRADRAPTARLLLNAARHQRTQDAFDTFELQAGVRGDAARGEQITHFVHRGIPGGADVDWSRQLQPNKFDGSLVAARSTNIGNFRVHFGGVLGTQLIYGHVGGELRYGPGSRDIDFQVMRFAATPPFAHRGDDTGWSVFAGASARIVAYNGMLGPNYDPGGEEIRTHPIVGRLAGGAAWTFQRGSVTFSLVHDTREFSEQRKPQQFGSLAVHWTF